MLHRFSGIALAGAFYALVIAAPVPSLQRYFLGHPVAVAATVLFCMALTQLAQRYLATLRAARQLEAISDRDLLPESLHEIAGLEPNLGSGDGVTSRDEAAGDAVGAGTMMIPSGAAPLSVDQTTPPLARANLWLEHLAELPRSVADTPLVGHLQTLLERQRRRGHSRQLSEDMRELSDRQSDADHDALQLVRIIVWAIPMLGFLGTVIGITQTLGGLDFTDGAAAVDRLKSGLYVAFDTTALGLVLSVAAIFLQFPVEKTSRQLLDQIDARAGCLLPVVLAEVESVDRDDPLRAFAQMSTEITRAVQSSVQMQTELWRRTIDEAHAHWHEAAGEAGTQLREALRETLGDSLGTTLQQHAESLRRANREGAESIDHRWQQWQTALSDNARVLLAHQKTLLSQGELLAESHARAKELERLQTTLDGNMRSLDTAVDSLDRSLQGVTGAVGMADAMRTLARAVDCLVAHLPPTTGEAERKAVPRRKAA